MTSQLSYPSDMKSVATETVALMGPIAPLPMPVQDLSPLRPAVLEWFANTLRIAFRLNRQKDSCL
ncbi:hypothetical protein PUV47_12400 [Pseudovibrio exalbescens]|uniref:hypothetical protein n=1 Tax=Pseudovibrio exalbescens TaxID=197461 RepID=UPI0023652FFE|nr:hypothetical protein [Pseudovibrio exalbescens]MDD7910720.1 hypothetical protein [Pseudovibrio exalbescens]